MEKEAYVYVQWFPGDKNDITDSLPRDLHLSDCNLIKLFIFALPSQIPSNFRSVAFPKTISSTFSSWLLTLPSKNLPPKQHKTSALLARNAELFSLTVLASAKTHSSVTSNNIKRQGFLDPTATQSEQHCIVRKLTKSWLQA